MQPEYFDEVQQWYVVFTRRRVPRCYFWHWLIKPSFNHLYLVRELPDGNTILIDPLKWGAAVQFVELPLDEYLLKAAQHENATAMLGYTADYRRCATFVPRGFYTCVMLVKAILGLKLRTLTPFGLYKALCRHPATTVIKPYVPYIQNQAGNA
jgi:hypothetical protein